MSSDFFEITTYESDILRIGNVLGDLPVGELYGIESSISRADRYQPLTDLILNRPESALSQKFMATSSRDSFRIHDLAVGWGDALEDMVLRLAEGSDVNLELLVTDKRDLAQLLTDKNNPGTSLENIMLKRIVYDAQFQRRDVFDLDNLPEVDLTIIGYLHPYINSTEHFYYLIRSHLKRSSFVAVSPYNVNGLHSPIRNTAVFYIHKEGGLRYITNQTNTSI